MFFLFISGEVINATRRLEYIDNIDINHCTFINCAGITHGGAFMIRFSPSMSIKSNRFEYCYAPYHGGGFFIDTDAKLVIIKGNCGFRCGSRSSEGQMVCLLGGRQTEFMDNVMNECNYIYSGYNPLHLANKLINIDIKFMNISNCVNNKEHNYACAFDIYQHNKMSLGYCVLDNNSYSGRVFYIFNKEEYVLSHMIITNNRPNHILFITYSPVVFEHSFISNPGFKYDYNNTDVSFDIIDAHLCIGRTDSFTSESGRHLPMILFLLFSMIE